MNICLKATAECRASSWCTVIRSWCFGPVGVAKVLLLCFSGPEQLYDFQRSSQRETSRRVEARRVMVAIPLYSGRLLWLSREWHQGLGNPNSTPRLSAMPETSIRTHRRKLPWVWSDSSGSVVV